MGASHVEDPEQLKYLNILFDFAYLKNPEDFENMVNSNTVRLCVYVGVEAQHHEKRPDPSQVSWL